MDWCHIVQCYKNENWFFQIIFSDERGFSLVSDDLKSVCKNIVKNTIVDWWLDAQRYELF